MEIIIIIVLVILNGVFAMSEMALVSSRKYKLESGKEKGSIGAKKALELTESPARFLSTVQIGITLIGIILGYYSGEALKEDFAAIIGKVEFLAPYATQIAGPLIVVVVTYVSIVFGELFPKQLGMTFPEKIATTVSPAMSLLSKIASPFVWLLSSSNRLLLRLLGIEKSSDAQVSEEEIKAMVKESAQVGQIDDIEHEMVERIFELGDAKAHDLFVHRSKVDYLTANTSIEDLILLVSEKPHSVYPVVEESSLDQIKGVALLKDIFKQMDRKDFSLDKLLREPVYITENTSAYKILEQFRSKRIHFGVVVDEYGSTKGILTMHDMMDALVGDISDDDIEDEPIKKLPGGRYLIDGDYSLKSFVKDTEIEISEDLIEDIQTVAGFVLHLAQEVPQEGAVILYEGYKFEVIDKDGQRIDKLLFSLQKPETDN